MVDPESMEETAGAVCFFGPDAQATNTKLNAFWRCFEALSGGLGRPFRLPWNSEKGSRLL